MRSTYKAVVPVLLLLLGGCAHNYKWKEYPIAPERISSEDSFTEGMEISVIEGKSSDERVFLGNVGIHRYYGTEQMLTDGIVDQLAKEMGNRRLKIENAAEKSIEIAVTGSRFETGAWKIAATLEFTVKLGDGTTKSYSARNSSPATVPRTYNGVVAKAVIEILNDPKVLSYINEPLRDDIGKLQESSSRLHVDG